MRKKIQKHFKSFNLSITFEYGTTIAHFLDTTLDINSRKYQLYRKLGEVTKYVNKLSNHPSNV